MDHHCLFTNSCIGLHNYCYFLRFLTATIFGLLMPVLFLLPEVVSISLRIVPALLTMLGLGMGSAASVVLPAGLLEDFGNDWPFPVVKSVREWDFFPAGLYETHVVIAWFSAAVVLVLNFNLWVFHMDILLRNETTIENLENWVEQRRSPYDRGLLANVREVCGPPPSWCSERVLKAVLRCLQWFVCGGREEF